jgi:hypothetical protein
MVGPWPDPLFLTAGYGPMTLDASSRTLFAEKLAIVQSSLQNQMLLHHINLAQKSMLFKHATEFVIIFYEHLPPLL